MYAETRTVPQVLVDKHFDVFRAVVEDAERRYGSLYQPQVVHQPFLGAEAQTGAADLRAYRFKVGAFGLVKHDEEVALALFVAQEEILADVFYRHSLDFFHFIYCVYGAVFHDLVRDPHFGEFRAHLFFCKRHFFIPPRFHTLSHHYKGIFLFFTGHRPIFGQEYNKRLFSHMRGAVSGYKRSLAVDDEPAAA